MGTNPTPNPPTHLLNYQTEPPPDFKIRVMEAGDVEKVATICMEAFDAQNKLTK